MYTSKPTGRGFLRNKVYHTSAIPLGVKALQACEMMNRLGKARTPFFFVLDFLLINPIVIPLKLIDNEHILFDIDGFNNAPVPDKVFAQGFSFKKTPPGFERYKTSFDLVKANLLYGNSYLLNLTLPSAIDTDLTLSEIFYRSKAAYKLWFRDRFVVFSPEMFVRIAENRIESHPMKGTIDASIPGAEEKILSDPKETAEHNTIVDLIRNDLSRIAQNVRVEKFRYITPVHTHQKKLLQVSSSVVGELAPTYPEKIGDIIFSLLPAGSVTGAPKKKTIEVILEAEQYDRGYYTGIFGYFDGQNLNSGVMIRFIENINGKFWFKSGGGITVNSCCEDEYQELIDKVYVPFV